MTTKTIAEQISALEATRRAKADAMATVMQKSIDGDRTTDKADQEEFDTLEAEVSAIDEDLVRLKRLEALQAKSAKPAVGADEKTGADTRDPLKAPLQIKKTETLDKGIRFARVARCVALGRLHYRPAEDIAKNLYPHDEAVVGVLTKAAVSAGSVGGTTWGHQLVGDETQVFADFAEFLRPQTILGKFGANGVPALRRIPFRTALLGQTGGGSGYWVGEGKAKPLTQFAFSRTTLEPLKVANIAVATMELLRDSSPSAEVLLRDSLAAALRERLDIDFIDPDKGASAGVSPASILNGVTPLSSEGNQAVDVREDIRAAFAAFIAANNAPTSGVWIMSAIDALGLSLMVNDLGQREFPGISMNGGTLEGLPVITSEYVTQATGGRFVALVNASDIFFADEGGIDIALSTEASLEMDTTPSNATVTASETTLISMFQTNSVALRAERTVNWARRRDSAVQWIEQTSWGQPEG